MTSGLTLEFIIIIIYRNYGPIASASDPVCGGGQAASPRAGKRDSCQSGGGPGKFFFFKELNDDGI